MHAKSLHVFSFRRVLKIGIGPTATRTATPHTATSPSKSTRRVYAVKNAIVLRVCWDFAKIFAQYFGTAAQAYSCFSNAAGKKLKIHWETVRIFSRSVRSLALMSEIAVRLPRLQSASPGGNPRGSFRFVER
jgi:hypothetical protein